MEFEKYDPEKHEEDVPAFFSDVAKAPTHFEKFRDAVEEALDDIEEVLEREVDFDVVIASTDMEALGNLEDIPEGLYFRGYSLGEQIHSHANRNAIFLAATTESDYWEAGLKNMAVHEEAHQEFFEYLPDQDHVVWESMMIEGHALVREKTVREEKDYKWRGDPRNYEGSAEEVLEELDKNREWQGDKYNRDNTSSIFTMDSEWEAIGYVIAQDVYMNVLERNEMEVDEPLAESRDWMRDQVEKSIIELY